MFRQARAVIIVSKTIKTEVSRQAGTEQRGLGREKLPEIRAWIPPSLRPQHGLTEEAQRDEVFRKVKRRLYKFSNSFANFFVALGSWYFEQTHTRKIPTAQQ